MKAIRNNYDPVMSKNQMVLTWRQKESYEKGKHWYPLVDNRLVPDIAFMIGPMKETDVWSKSTTKVDILFLLREDKESVHLGKRNVTKLEAIIESNELTRGLSFKL